MLHPKHPEGLCAAFGRYLSYRASEGMSYRVHGEFRDSGECSELLKIRSSCVVDWTVLGSMLGSPYYWAQSMLIKRCKEQQYYNSHH